MPAPKTSTGFVGLNDYLSANGPAVSQTVNSLNNDATQAAQKAQGEANSAQLKNGAYSAGKDGGDPTSLADYSQAQGDASTAQTKLNALGSYGGIADSLKQNAQGSYTQGDNALDANLVGAAGGKQFQATQSKFGDLQNYLGSQVTNAYNQGAQYKNNPASASPLMTGTRRGNSPVYLASADPAAAPAATPNPDGAPAAPKRRNPGLVPYSDNGF